MPPNKSDAVNCVIGEGSFGTETDEAFSALMKEKKKEKREKDKEEAGGKA